jgi:hypothetical protein
MSHYMDFDPHYIRERNEQMLRKANTVRLERRLHENRGGYASRFTALLRRRATLLHRLQGLQGSPSPCRGR